MKNQFKIAAICYFIGAICFFITAIIGYMESSVPFYLSIPIGICLTALGVISINNKRNKKNYE